MDYSATQGSNLVSLVGLLMIILRFFHINIATEELQTVLGAIITLVGVAINWFHRYKKGDLTFGGFRK